MKVPKDDAVDSALAPYRARSNREVATLVDAFEGTRGTAAHPSLRTLAASRAILGAGKRYRYAFACLAYQGLTGWPDFESAARPATWLELYHVYTLFLDDIMDEDERRRTFPSAWSTGAKAYRGRDAARAGRLFRSGGHRYGASMAILDALRIRSLAERAIQTANVGVAVREQLLEVLTETDLKLSDGQGLDIDFEQAKTLSEEEYARMSELKTGVLYVAAAKTGSLLASASLPRARAVEEFARRFALAFQDRDDLLGAGVVRSEIGGSTQGDIEKGKRTRLFAIAISALPAAKRSAFLRAYGKGPRTTAKDVGLVRTVFRQHALPDMTERIKENVERAVDALHAANLAEPHGQTLELMARAQLTRQK